MGPSKARSTRKLRSWMVEQVTSGRYPGLVWDDEDQTMFRIPWKHAGKQDFRSDEDAAIFKAWAEFKGKMTAENSHEPATWKTRLRCALNKSPEFTEETERSQLDISEPYKVYRLVPVHEQGAVAHEELMRSKRGGGKGRRTKRKATDSSCSEDGEDELQEKRMKEESVSAPLSVEDILARGDVTLEAEGASHQIFISQGSGLMEEFQLDFRIETNPPPPLAGEDGFQVVVSYAGQEVLSREVQGQDVRITYHAPSPLPPTPAHLTPGFPRIGLPEPPSGLRGNPELFQLLPHMERGVLLTSNDQGVYLRRYCRGRVYWVGPHAAAATHRTPNKIQRNTEGELIFSKEAFRQQLEAYQQGGDAPCCDVVLCFGEELIATDDQSKKLILVKITFPWAERQVQNLKTIMAPFCFFQSLASQSPDMEITLDLVPVDSVI